MTIFELEKAIAEITQKCDTSVEQQAVKAVLLSLTAAIITNRQVPLMRHISEFTKRELITLQALKN